MPVALTIALRAETGPASPRERQSLQVLLRHPSGGEEDCASVSAYSQKELVTLLRALDISRGVQATFSAEELELLREWRFVAGEFPPDDEGRIRLGYDDTYIEQLLLGVQERLFDTLFPTKGAHRMLGKVLGTLKGKALHVRLEVGGKEGADNAQLIQCPWEVLSYPEKDLWQGRRASFSRYIKCDLPVRKPRVLSRLNVLVITSRPSDLLSGTASDAQSIERGRHTPAMSSGRVQIKELGAATLEALDAYLDGCASEDLPQVIHFDGHGAFGRLCSERHLTESASAVTCPECDRALSSEFCGHLAFERSDGKVRWVSATDLATKLREWNVQLVVLNACMSAAARRGDDIFNGVAQSLIRSVPAVVASALHIDWEAGTDFAQFFYERLVEGKLLVEAMDCARQRLYAWEKDTRQWYRPVLYLRSQGTAGVQLFGPQRERRDPDGRKATSRLASQEPPTIYLHTYGAPPAASPGRLLIDWSPYFDREVVPRRVPEPDVWATRLLPQLRKVRSELPARSLVRLADPTAALTAGFAFGHTFPAIGRYRLQVDQPTPGAPAVWFSDEPPPAGEPDARFSVYGIGGNPRAQDAVVIAWANPKQPLWAVAAEVGTYLDEPAAFVKEFAQEAPRFLMNEQLEQASKRFRSILILEARGRGPGGLLLGWEAATLAASSAALVKEFVVGVRAEGLHLFLAVPLGLAVFLGHQWNAIGTPVQCYEYVGGEQHYAATLQVQLS